MRLFIRVISIMLIMLIMGAPKVSYADSVNKDIDEVSIEDKMNLDLLYVIEEMKYKETMSKDALIVSVKNNFMSVKTDDIREKELKIINSAKSFFVLGPIDKDVFPSENLGGHLFYNNKESFVNKNNVDLSNDLVIANEESVVDILNAIQIGNVEDRILLLIKDNKLTPENENFIKEHGKDKNILFVEGELKIPQELKYNILQLADSPKYEIDTFRISKTLEDKKIDLKSYVPKKIEVNKQGIDLFNKIQNTSKNAIDKNSKQNEEIIQSKSKLISYDEEKDVEEFIFDKIKSYRFIKNLQKQDNVSLTIESNKEINEDEPIDLSLMLTYANPASIHKYISTEKQVFVTSKSTTPEIIYSVMEGDYGNEEERRENLTKEGYNYEEIQKEINTILALRERSRRRNTEIATASINANAGNSSNVNNSSLHSAFIRELLKMEGWTYSQERRWENGYADCSSIIIRALINTGMVSNHSNMTTMTIAGDSRFYEIPMNSLQIGDILWYPGHVEVYMGGNKTFGAFRPGKASGYASGINRFSKAYRIAN